MRFKYEMYNTEISFLDTTVFKVDNKLQSKVYVKPTNRKGFLTQQIRTS